MCEALVVNIKFCSDVVQSLICGCVEEQCDISPWFEKLCNSVTNLIEQLVKYYKKIDNKMREKCKETILLYLNCILSMLELLIEIFLMEQKTEALITDARAFAVRQLKWCFTDLESFILNEFSTVIPNDSFIKWMDTALELISALNVKDKEKISEMRTATEEVISHAMSICQLTLSEDRKIITGSSQTVLEAVETLASELSKENPNPSMVNLFVDTCNDKLCTLERKVNTAILKLSLKVFSDITGPLSRFYDYSTSNNSEKMEDELIADLDMHVDYILQIAFFAVGCSTDAARTTKMKSCLAILEALEVELVPAICSVKGRNVCFAKIFRDLWIKEVTSLQKLIYRIIDPFAFLQVIYNEISNDTKEIKFYFDRHKILSNSHIGPVISKTKVLEEFLEIALKDMKCDNLEEINKKYSSVKSVSNEVRCAADILLSKDENTEVNGARVLKRCYVLVSLVKKLWLSTADDEIMEQSIQTEDQKGGQKEEKPLLGNPFFDHLIEKGKDILKNRSILNRTENKNCAVFLLESRRKFQVPESVQLRRLNITSSHILEDGSMDLHITEILEALTDLSQTISE